MSLRGAEVDRLAPSWGCTPKWLYECGTSVCLALSWALTDLKGMKVGATLDTRRRDLLKAINAGACLKTVF
jgi:hypothetical protein